MASIFKKTARATIILVLVFLILSGCGYVPTRTVSFITSSGDNIYFSLSGGKIRVMDKNDLQWRDFVIPDMDDPHFFNLFAVDSGDIIFQAQNSYPLNRSLYVLNEQKGIRKYLNGEDASAMGADSEYVYFIRTESNRYPHKENWQWRIRGFRYDKRFEARQSHHFDDFPSLLVTDIWEDEDNFWYACIDNPEFGEMNALSGTNVLVARSKMTGALEKFELDAWEGDWGSYPADDTRPLLSKERNARPGTSKMLWVRGDKDYIWLFSRPDNADTHLIKFSKARKTIEYKQGLITGLVPFRGQSPDIELWAVGSDYKTCNSGQCVYSINKNDLKSTTLSMPKGTNLQVSDWSFLNSNILRPFNPFCEDEDSLWIYVEQPRKVFTPMGSWVPYLARISKKDGSLEMIRVEPTVGEAIKTVIFNAVGWLIVPFFRG